jgi:uncharacterized protein YbjT (DUF2867 family)
MTYLITGATGDIGSKVVERLLQRGERPRIFVRDIQKAQSRFGDRVEIFVGDLADPASLKAALKDTDALFLVNSGPEIPIRDNAAANLARSASVKHLVKLSSMDVEQGLAIGAWHEQGEAAIRKHGIPYTFVQPTGFMSNLFAWAQSIKVEGIVRSSTGEGRRAFIHSDDIADVVVAALTSPQYRGRSLPITGPEALSFSDIARRIGVAIRKPILYQITSDDDARQRYSATGATSEETEAHVSLWRAIREGRLAQITDEVERILGRRPLTLEHWLAENASAFC